MADQKNTRKRKRKFLECFEKRKGIVSLACLDAGIERKTFYDWQRKDKIFEWKSEAIRDREIGSVAEDNLANAVLAGDPKMTMFYLRSRMQKYKPSLETKLSGDVKVKGTGLPPPIVKVIIVNPSENAGNNPRPVDVEDQADTQANDGSTISS